MVKHPPHWIIARSWTRLIKTKIKPNQQMQTVIDIGYIVIGVLVMLGMVGIGVVGIVKVIKDINKIKDIE